MKKREDEEEEGDHDREESDGGDRTAAGVINVWDCGSPLYDSFELVSVAHLIERNMRALPPPPPSGRSSAAEMDMRYRGLLARRSSGHRKRKSEESTPKVRKLKSGFYSFFATVGLIKK
ncbi:uncharacterized protein LOC116033066 [Ipomoea triloba]|uniref:uncharacterized protein LOC116033066 n=1 Tax=Ipomoea triloba TaxID=35885 RepID=UPI00125D0277|nr:uncharacterized protein LOC116033066 [Ipomoea triloba]